MRYTQDKEEIRKKPKVESSTTTHTQTKPRKLTLHKRARSSAAAGNWKFHHLYKVKKTLQKN